MAKDLEIYSSDDVMQIKIKAKKAISLLSALILILVFGLGSLLSLAVIKIWDAWELQARISGYFIENKNLSIEKNKLISENRNLSEKNLVLKTTLDKTGQEAKIYAVTAKVQDYYAKAGFSRFTKSYLHIHRIVKAVYQIAPLFEIGRTEDEKINTILSIIRIESDFNPETVGSFKEIGLTQILPRDVDDLKKRLKTKGYTVSGNDFATYTNIRMGCLHLEDKMKEFGLGEKGVKAYNGRHSKPSYIFRWKGFMNILEENNS